MRCIPIVTWCGRHGFYDDHRSSPGINNLVFDFVSVVLELVITSQPRIDHAWARISWKWNWQPISISIASGCIPCTRYHIIEGRRLGATVDNISNAIHTGAAVANASQRKLLSEIGEGSESVPIFEVRQNANRQSLLCGLGSAVARNDVGQLKTYMKLSRTAGISDTDLMAVVGLAEKIKEKAASHLDRIIAKLDADCSIARDAARLCT